MIHSRGTAYLNWSFVPAQAGVCRRRPVFNQHSADDGIMDMTCLKCLAAMSNRQAGRRHAKADSVMIHVIDGKSFRVLQIYLAL